MKITAKTIVHEKCHIKQMRGMLKGTGLTKSLLKSRTEERKLEDRLDGRR